MEEEKPICCLYLQQFWRTYVIILAPVLLGFLFLIDRNEDGMEPKDSIKCLYLLCLMAVFWMTQALHSRSRL